MDKKKLIYTIIGIVTILSLIIGATYAYFMGSNSAYGTTKTQAELGEAVSIALSNPTDELHLRLSASDMSVVNAGKNYYMTSDNNMNYVSGAENNIVSRVQIVGDSNDIEYSCTYNINVTKPEGINNGDMSLIFTTNNASISGISSGSEIDLASASNTYSVSFTYKGLTDGTDLVGVSVKLNNTIGNQNHLSGKSLAVQFSNGELSCTSEVVTETSICSLASDSTVSEGEYGAKYNCKVDPNKDAYTFYLIDNNDDGTSDLIMSHNINAAGENVISNESSDLGMMAWYADSSDNSYGPITAMTYLYNATKSWTNVEPVNYEYKDKEVQANSYGYTSFISSDGIATITGSDGTSTTIGSESEPLRTRMPVYTENTTYSHLNEIVNISSNQFLHNNLDLDWINGPYGYWTLSSAPRGLNYAWYVYAAGGVAGGNLYGVDEKVNLNNQYGVRPVITIKL